MGIEEFVNNLLIFLVAVAVLAGVPLAVATVVGLIISFLQAITQIQDQTLSSTVKIVAIAATFMAIGGVLIAPLYEATVLLFDTFWMVQ